MQCKEGPSLWFVPAAEIKKQQAVEDCARKQFSFSIDLLAVLSVLSPLVKWQQPSLFTSETSRGTRLSVGNVRASNSTNTSLALNTIDLSDSSQLCYILCVALEGDLAPPGCAFTSLTTITPYDFLGASHTPPHPPGFPGAAHVFSPTHPVCTCTHRRRKRSMFVFHSAFSPALRDSSGITVV